MSTTPAPPTSPLVAVAFLRALLGQSGGVGTRLPAKVEGKPESWADTGFVQITSVGGNVDPYALHYSPVLGVRCWAVAPNSKQPPWNVANQLAERIRTACYAVRSAPPVVQLPPGYPTCYVQSAYLLSEPMPVQGDDSSYACYRFDLQLHWVGEPL